MIRGKLIVQINPLISRSLLSGRANCMLPVCLRLSDPRVPSLSISPYGFTVIH